MPKETGLRYWMDRVLEELPSASKNLSADAVHDLRVSLRRCRSMAEVVHTFDPDSAWPKMRKAGKEAFSGLGELRDCQVQIELVGRLFDENDGVRQKLLVQLHDQEGKLKTSAKQALEKFDTAQWRKWAKYLSERIAHYAIGGELYQEVALERWRDARELHRTAMRVRSNLAMHRLRIGVKKFRYVVENFLPAVHEASGDSLKEVQDLLGEVHDIDVLWDTAVRTHVFADAAQRLAWREKLQRERKQRVDRYREMAANRAGVWEQWRAGLPDGEAIDRVTFVRIATWSSILDPSPRHSRRVSSIALRLFDALRRAELLPDHGHITRNLLRAAALMHDVGKSKKSKGHQKASRKLILGTPIPWGWSATDLITVALVARYHRGALPGLRSTQQDFLPAPEYRRMRVLAAILRLANGIEHAMVKGRMSVRVEAQRKFVEVRVDGLTADASAGEDVAAARYLLESILGLPIFIRESDRPERARP